jgi:hypothetical protein
MHGCTTLSRDAFLCSGPPQLQESHSQFISHGNTGILQLPASSSNFAGAPQTMHNDMGKACSEPERDAERSVPY